jgi:hypothetical protein
LIDAARESALSSGCRALSNALMAADYEHDYPEVRRLVAALAVKVRASRPPELSRSGDRGSALLGRASSTPGGEDARRTCRKV